MSEEQKRAYAGRFIYAYCWWFTNPAAHGFDNDLQLEVYVQISSIHSITWGFEHVQTHSNAECA